jgi:hypothetical protein
LAPAVTWVLSLAGNRGDSSAAKRAKQSQPQHAAVQRYLNDGA